MSPNFTLSVVDTMLHDSPDLVIHKQERSGSFGDHRLNKRKFGVSWRSSSTVARARRGMSVHCPAGTKSLLDILRIARSSMTSLWRRETTSKKWVKDITIISCFVTTIKLPHALRIYSTVFLWRSVCGCIFKDNAATNLGKMGNSIIFVCRLFMSATVKKYWNRTVFVKVMLKGKRV